ncbi:MAG TPA: permease-like cell division protein FtsX [Dongiaceae bacterium]|nr:permease-like cell division protein FtsX [Dongiaceae bacterium]
MEKHSPTPTKKANSKTVSQQKRHRRQWITFLRMCRYGVNNFTRNAWLTVAATAVMTITLFVVFVSVAAHNILSDTVTSLRDKVTMSIYLDHDTSQSDVDKAVTDVRNLSSVLSVSVQTPDQARTDFANQHKQDAGTLNALEQATDRFPWTISIKVVDINNTQQLADLVNNDAAVKTHLDANSPPSFAGDRREVIQKIAGAGDFAQKLGIIASVLFIGISMLIIFNTIRMAIFNRREEIQMMKLIGAEHSFIRGPFLVEAIVYGFFAALVATGLGYAVLVFAAPSLQTYGITVDSTLNMVTYYAGIVLLSMILIGAVIGIISSLLATRRYLKM